MAASTPVRRLCGQGNNEGGNDRCLLAAVNVFLSPKKGAQQSLFCTAPSLFHPVHQEPAAASDTTAAVSTFVFDPFDVDKPSPTLVAATSPARNVDPLDAQRYQGEEVNGPTGHSSCPLTSCTARRAQRAVTRVSDIRSCIRSGI